MDNLRVALRLAVDRVAPAGFDAADECAQDLYVSIQLLTAADQPSARDVTTKDGSRKALRGLADSIRGICLQISELDRESVDRLTDARVAAGDEDRNLFALDAYLRGWHNTTAAALRNTPHRPGIKGAPKKVLEAEIDDEITEIYWRVTGRRPSRNNDCVDTFKRGGPFYAFMSDVLAAIGVPLSGKTSEPVGLDSRAKAAIARAKSGRK